MRRWVRALLPVALLALVAACGHAPDTTLHPAPSAVDHAALQRPFAGGVPAVDPDTQATRWQAQHNATWLSPITRGSQARWLNAFQDLATLPAYLRAAQVQGALATIVVYAIPNRGCANYTEGLPYGDYDRSVPRPDSYRAFVTQLVQVLGPTKAIVVLEPDAVPADCFDSTRAATLAGAVSQLAAAGQHVYLDAGHPSWVKSGPTAQRLLEAGVNRAEGVSLNVSNRYPTSTVADFGEELSQLIGGRDYLVDTSRNGAQTNPATLSGDWCNRPDQALGRQQSGTTDPVRYPHMAAQLWIKPPGESDGNAAVFPTVNCHGEPAGPGQFSPAQARDLIVNDPSQPAAARASARAAAMG